MIKFVVYTCGGLNTTASDLKAQNIPFEIQQSKSDCITNAIKAWEIGINSDSSFICVMPDDLHLTSNFNEKINRLVKNENTCYSLFHCNSKLSFNPVPDCCGMGIVLSRQNAIDLLKYHNKSKFFKSDSELISAYCHINNIPIYVAWPNLTEHIGDISRVYKNARIRKSVWFEE